MKGCQAEGDVMTRPCCHHWLIETADGPDSRGRCKFCHAEKVFANYMPVTNISDYIALRKAERQSRKDNGGFEPYHGYGIRAIA